MASIQTLLDAGNSPDSVQQARHRATAIYPEFPHDGCAYFLSELLALANMYVGIEPLAEGLATALKDHGWARVDVQNYIAGDIGVANHAPGTTNAAHIYLALERIDDNTVRIIDNQDTKPHTRNLGSGRKTPTHYFLRAPIAQKSAITVQVNDAVVAGAEGFIGPDGRSQAWVRPVADALGASITGFTLSSVTLNLGQNTQTI